MSSQKFHILPNYLPVTDTLNKRRAGEVFERHSSYHWWSALKLLHIEISIFAIGSTAFHECFFARGCTICFGFLGLYLLFWFPAKLWKLQNLGCHAGCWGKLELMQKLFDFSPRCVFKRWGKLKPKPILVKAAQNKNKTASRQKYYSSKPLL